MDFGDFLREASQEMEFSEGTRRVSAPYRFPHIAPRTFYAFLASTTPPPMSHWASLIDCLAVAGPLCPIGAGC